MAPYEQAPGCEGWFQGGNHVLPWERPLLATTRRVDGGQLLQGSVALQDCGGCGNERAVQRGDTGHQSGARPGFVMLVLEALGRNSDQDRTKRRFLDEWTRAINQCGRSGRWSRDVSNDPGDIKDILGRQEAGG